MDTIRLLEELIKIDSYTIEKANEAIEFAADYLKCNGLDGKVMENNGYKSYVAVIGSGKETIVLNGHLDVVPGNNCQFNPVEIDGRIYGRGSMDMKSGCAAMMNVMLALKDEPIKCQVMLQLVSDEENGGFNCSDYLVEEGYVGDFVICTEPTNLNIAIQSKGFMRIDIETSGVSAHSSRPWEGDNAILKNIENYNKIEDLGILKVGSDYYERSTVTLALIDGGDIYNKVPDKSVMGLDIRYVPHLNPHEIIKEIETVVDGKVILKTLGDSIHSPLDNIYVKDFIDTVKSFKDNKDAKIFGQHGSSDARFFSRKGIPVLEFGPKGENLHGDNEYVEIQSVYRLEEILKDFIRKF